MCEQGRLCCTSPWGQWTPVNEHVYCVAIALKMTEGVEQQICIKFCIKLEQSSTETIQMSQKAFRDDSKNVAQIKMWHKSFKAG